MAKQKHQSGLIALALLTAAVATPAPARAGGVVGAGTPTSCTEVAFVTALSGGGAVSFNCGPAPVTITITAQRSITANTSIDGGGLVTLSGGGASVQLFLVSTPGVTLNLSNLIIRDFGRPAAYISSGAVNVINTTFIGHQRSALTNIGTTARLSISASTFLSNTSNGSGGAIYNAGVLTVTDSLFQGNFTQNSYNGGAIYSAGSGAIAVASIDRTTFRDNRAGYGGAIENYSVMTITNSAIVNNVALNNGGSGGGGLIQGTGGNLSLVNVTFSGNTVPSASRGAAIFIGGTAASQARLQNVTIANNVPATPANGSLALNNAGTVVTLANTLIRDNGCSLTSSSTLPTLVDGGGNLAFNNATGCPGINADPQLTPLGDNGGPTLTYAISNGASPAVNAGIGAGCSATDQRGVLRPQGGTCDIGAVEWGAVPAFDAITPATVCGGASSLLITATGTNFIVGPSGTRIRLNGAAMPTTFVSPTQLQATVGAADLALPPHTLVFQLETPVLDGGVSVESRTIEVQNCTIEPIAGLSATSNSPTNLGGATQFTATVAAGNNITYVWDFGDGQTGSGPNPAHVYADVGSYIATVTATNSAGSATADTVVNVNLSTTGLIVGDLSSKFGAVITYTYVVTHVAPTGSQPVTVIISGNVPANTALVSAPGLDVVATGGDYGNGYVQTPQPVVLQAGQSAPIVWTVRPTTVTGDIVNQARTSTDDGRLQIFQRNRVRRSLASLVYKN
jgi:predicted outer membrane repeat protein